MPGIARGPHYPHQQPEPFPLHWQPVPGQVVFFMCLLLIVLVVIGWYLIAEKCRRCG